MDDRPKKKEVHEIRTEVQLRESLKRCTLLLKNSPLLARMPDSGKGIRDRFSALLDHAKELGFYVLISEYGGGAEQHIEQAKREENEDDASDAKEEKEEENDTKISGGLTQPPPPPRRQVPPEQQDQQNYTDEQVSTYGMACMLKNRSVRGDIYKELQRMYASNLSQSEIRRLADASSPYLLMSYDDTIEMERRFAELEKKAMMRRIRERLLAAGEAIPENFGEEEDDANNEGETTNNDNNNDDHEDNDEIQYE